MTLNEYQDRAIAFATFGGSRIDYAVLGLAEEAGELAGKMAKFVRRTGLSPRHAVIDAEFRTKALAELGDCLWMVQAVAYAMGWTLERVAESNLRKLDGRRERGTIVGEGDDR